MKTINVVAAAIIHDNKLLLTERGYGNFKDKWEFPGGKIEENETMEDAIIREIKEELDAKITPKKYLCKVEYDYGNFYLIMNVFICSLDSENLNFKEHEAAKWIDLKKLDSDVSSLDLLPADVLVIPYLKDYLKNN